MWRFIPDWLIYGLIVGLFYLNASRVSHQVESPQPPPPEELGPLLPGESPRDPAVLVEIGDPESGVGTAFAVDDDGSWVTARHVVDSCNRVGLAIGRLEGLRVASKVTPDSDTAILKTKWSRDPLPTDLTSRRQIGEYGYFFGYPKGQPGEVAGKLLGRQRMIVRGRYQSEEAILAWTEIGRTLNLKGSLGGLSGGPVLDSDGEVIGVVAAESPRRGRIYTVAPRSLQELIAETDEQAVPINIKTYGREADRLRRSRRITKVFCLVDGA